jgi:ribosomal protein L22
MPRRSKVLALPAAVKAWLDDSLVAGNFSGYEVLEQELKTRGLDISKSSLQRYGSEFEATIKRLKMTTEMARAVVQASPDDAGDMQEATVRLATQKLFSHLNNPELKDEDVAGLTKAIADLTRASVSQKRYAAQVTEKLNSAEKNASAATKNMTPEQAYLAAIETARRAYGVN